MSLFCPPSVLDKLNIYKDFIFDVTIRCMDFYKKTFNNLAYPFKKYDQLFIREFAALAMENAGIVTFDEANLLPK
jgi:aminopeptidase N